MATRALKALRVHRENLLYLVVGGWNTVFQYVTFSLLYYLLSGLLFSSVILFLSYVLSSINGFLGFRLIAINMILLPFMLAYTPLNAYVVQALFAVISVVMGYFGNKYFTFRATGRAPDTMDPS